MPAKSDAPRLPGWSTLQEVADKMGVSRQAVHQAAEDGVFRTLHRIGGERPVWLVQDSELTPELRLGPTPEREQILRANRNTGHDNDSRGEVARPEQENARS